MFSETPQVTSSETDPGLPEPSQEDALRIALLLSTDTFESFFGGQMTLTRDDYVYVWRGGWCWSYCRMLQREGIRPVIYIASLAHAGRYETPEGFAVRFLPLRRWYWPWHRFPVVKRSPPARYLAGLANGAALIPALRRSLEEDRIDVLVIQEFWPARYDYVSRRVDIPMIAAHQGVMDRRQLKFAKRRAFARAFAMTTQTQAEADKVIRFGATATPIVNSVDSDFFVPNPDRRDDERRIVLCVARLLHEHKRQGDLIRALALLPERWRLQLVGSGPDREYLGELVREAGVEHRVEFLAFINDKADLRHHLQRCDVFALVSRREGMPLALLEAMSCGAAVVGTDIPGIGEVVKDGVSGLLAPVGDAERIAERIEEAYERRDELGRRAREDIERNYSERAVAVRLAEIVREAANAPRSGLRPHSPGEATGGAGRQ